MVSYKMNHKNPVISHDALKYRKLNLVKKTFESDVCVQKVIVKAKATEI